MAAPAYLRTPRGETCPRVITAEHLNSDPDVSLTRAHIALVWNATLPSDDGWTSEVTWSVLCAMQDGDALVCQYRNSEGMVTARCLWPSQITVTSERHIVFRAWDSSRKTVRTFRADAVLDCHALTFPFECDPRLPDVVRFGVGAFGSVATISSVAAGARC